MIIRGPIKTIVWMPGVIGPRVWPSSATGRILPVNQPWTFGLLATKGREFIPLPETVFAYLLTALHSSNLVIIVSHLHMVVFASLSLCYIRCSLCSTITSWIFFLYGIDIQWYLSDKIKPSYFFVCLFVLVILSFLFLLERERPLAGCTSWLYVSPFLSSLRRNLRPPRIYNSLQDCSSTPGCQTIQMRHHRSPFSSTLQATVFTVQSQWLTV